MQPDWLYFYLSSCVHGTLYTKGKLYSANIYSETWLAVLPPWSTWPGMKAGYTLPPAEDRRWNPLLNIVPAFMRQLWWECVNFSPEAQAEKSPAVQSQASVGAQRRGKKMGGGWGGLGAQVTPSGTFISASKGKNKMKRGWRRTAVLIGSEAGRSLLSWTLRPWTWGCWRLSHTVQMLGAALVPKSRSPFNPGTASPCFIFSIGELHHIPRDIPKS